MIESNTNEPTFLFDDLPLHWQMTRCERYAFASVLDVAAAEVAIEIGTFKGGSLQIISRKARKIYSIDSSPDCKETLGDRFPNVEFLTGDSKRILPSLLGEISTRGESLGFVLIDGDHSTEGVRADINAVLQYQPIRPVYIIFHDSFNPPCRKGILAAAWRQCPHVHYVEIDFIPGAFFTEKGGRAKPRSMFGGLSLALMLPEKRTHELVIHQSQKGLYDVVFPRSRHGSMMERAVRGPLRKLKRKLIGKQS